MSRRQDDDTDKLDGGDGEGPWELDPNDPNHPDFDLSESAGYTDYDYRRRLLPLPRWLLLLVTVVILVALFSPFCIRSFT